MKNSSPCPDSLIYTRRVLKKFKREDVKRFFIEVYVICPKILLEGGDKKQQLLPIRWHHWARTKLFISLIMNQPRGNKIFIIDHVQNLEIFKKKKIVFPN